MTTITALEAELLVRMKRDNAAAGFPFVAGPWWSQVNDNFNAYFKQQGIGNVEAQVYNASFATWPDADNKAYIGFAYHLFKHSIKSRNDWILKKAPSSGLMSAGYPTKDGVVSWDQLISSHSLIEIHQYVPVLTEPVTVLDLGAGWGRIGHTLCQANPQARYIICDLPESLLIAFSYLHRLLPAACHPYDVLLDEPGIYFLGSQGILRLPDKTVDVLINIASFQEMTKEQVAAYLAIANNKAHWLYTLQWFDKMPNVSKYVDHGWTEMFHKETVWYDSYAEALYHLDAQS